jgi:hypothetical protein
MFDRKKEEGTLLGMMRIVIELSIIFTILFISMSIGM